MPVWCKVFWEVGNAIRRVWLTGLQTNGEIWIKKCWFLIRASSWDILSFWAWHSMAKLPQQPLQNESFLQRLKSAGKWSSLHVPSHKWPPSDTFQFLQLIPVYSSAQTGKLQQTSDGHLHDCADRRFAGCTGHRWSQIMGSLMPVSVSALPPPPSTLPVCLCWQNGNLAPISASPDRCREVNLTTKWKSTAIPRSSSIGWG